MIMAGSTESWSMFMTSVIFCRFGPLFAGFGSTVFPSPSSSVLSDRLRLTEVLERVAGPWPAVINCALGPAPEAVEVEAGPRRGSSASQISRATTQGSSSPITLRKINASRVMYWSQRNS